MAVFPISSNAVQLNTTAPTSADQFSNGIRLKADNSAVFAALSGGGQYQNGFLLDANGAVICVDATSGLPAGTQYTNGLPISPSGALCVSTGPVDEWIGGLPFAANGALAAAGLIETDPFYSSVSLLLHCDGTDGSTTFVDNSPSPITPTIVGDAQIDTAVAKFGTGSGLFDGTGDSTLWESGTGWHFGTGDFTLEAFVRTSVPASLQGFMGRQEGATNGLIQFRKNAGIFEILLRDVDNTGLITLGGGVVATNTWQHVAATRQSGTLRLFVDGTLVNSATSTVNLTFGSVKPLAIGSIHDGTVPALSWTGNIDEVRVTKGVARYTASFAVPTAAFPNS